MALGVKGITLEVPTTAMPPNIEQELALDSSGAARVANIGGLYVDGARGGRRFHGGSQLIAAGLAPIQTVPAATAALVLFNAAKAGGVSLIIDLVSAVLGSGTAAAGGALYLGVFGTPVTIPTAAANYAICSQSGSPTKVSAALFATAVTVVAPPGGSLVWTPAAAANQLAAANVGQCFVERVEGRIVIPPQFCLGITMFSGAGTTPLYSYAVAWEERVVALV